MVAPFQSDNLFQDGTVATLTVVVPLPVITESPQEQRVAAGATVNFTVTAHSPVPLSYQWQFNGQVLTNGGRISGATTPALALDLVQPVSEGFYQAVVWNVAGAVTSAPAPLTIIAPGILDPHLQTTNRFVSFDLRGLEGRVFAIEASPDLLYWSTVALVTNATGATRYTGAMPTNSPSLFYRARLLPP